MLHLTTERLAELGDAAPTPDERAHFTRCADCSRERDAYVALLGLARDERTAVGFPVSSWDLIAAGLARDTLSSDARERIPQPTARRLTPWPLRIAAGLLFAVSGAMLGRASAGGAMIPAPAVPVSATGAFPAGLPRAAADPAPFSSVEDARATQEESGLRYQQAAAFLAEHDSSGAVEGNAMAYRSRLAALDRVISTTREAMREVPHDPVINGYYLTTLGQREATIRQLNTALPTSLRLTSF